MNGPAPGGLVIDTSAAVAVLLDEIGGTEIATILAGADRRLMSAATRVELGIVIEGRFGPSGADAVDRLLRDADVTMVPVDEEAADRALGAWRRYGKGRHPAALDYGDCFTYGLAEQRGLPILCVGNDFVRTDLPCVGPTSS